MTQAMNLPSDDFELFGIPHRFTQDSAVLDARWKDLQRKAHPDRFAVQGSAAKRVAMQWSVRINEAYQRLKDPQRRAACLCELHGVSIGAEDNTAMPAAFLIQQMEWREALDEAETEAALDTLEGETRATRSATLERLATLMDKQQDWPAAAHEVRVLMFLARFAEAIHARRELLEQ